MGVATEAVELEALTLATFYIAAVVEWRYVDNTQVLKCCQNMLLLCHETVAEIKVTVSETNFEL